MTGTEIAWETRQVASTPTGRIAGPLTPPVPNPSAGRRRSTSTTRPGTVFTTVTPSAPASTAMRAASAMFDSVGESFTNSGRRVSARAPATTARSDAGSEPNSVPPCFTLGQLTFSSKPSTPRGFVAAANSSPATTRANSSVANPTTLYTFRVSP